MVRGPRSPPGSGGPAALRGVPRADEGIAGAASLPRACRAAALLAVLLAVGAGCGGPPRGESPPDTTDREETMEDTSEARPSIRDVMDMHRDTWMDRPEVTGVGVGRCDGEPCIVLYLIRPTDAAERDLPDSVEGYPVRLEVTGRVVPRRPPDDTADGGS